MANEPKSIPYVELLAISEFVEQRCREENKNFLMCKIESRNPEHCLNQGNQVKSCVEKVYQETVTKCPADLEKLSSCMVQGNMDLSWCRKELEGLERCGFNSNIIKDHSSK